MQKISTKPLQFSQKIKINFEGGELSSDTGLLVFHEFCEKMNVQELLSKYLPENRKGKIEHKKPAIFYQQITRIMAGYSSNNAAIYLKNDPVMKIIHQGKNASASTCCRLEQTFSFDDLKKLQKIQDKLIDQSYEIEKPKEVWFDVDTTYDPASGRLNGANYNTHYAETGFSPIVMFDGKTGDFIKGNLRPGNYYCSKKAVPFLEPVFRKYQKKGISMKIRMDSGFACPEIYELCEKYNVQYVIKLKNNSVLKGKFQKNILTEEIYKNKTEVFSEFEYQAKSWSKPRRVLARVEWKGDELFPICTSIVTSDLECTSEEGFKFYNNRAVVENYIQEGKEGFSWDHLSNQSFESNAVKFQVFLTALQLTQFLRRLCFPEKQKTITIPTIRTRLLKVASKIVKNSRNLIVKCATCFPFQKFFLHVLNAIQNLPKIGFD